MSEQSFAKVIFAEDVVKQLLQREIDHLNWVRKAGQFQRDENIISLGVETDEHKCAFGKWYYGEDRKLVEMETPQTKSLLIKIEDPHKKLHASAREVEEILKKGKEFHREAVTFYGASMSQHLKSVQEILGEIVKVVSEHSSAVKKNSNSLMQKMAVTCIISMVLGIFLALIMGIVSSRSILRPVRRVIDGLSGASEQISSAAHEVSATAQSLADGSSAQAAAIEETSSSLEEITEMTKGNANNANQVDSIMKQASQVMIDANGSMHKLTMSMQEISLASMEISKIIKTIDEISFQTNLLALNAAVEAARAGQAGAGFAVVADEVRNLAMRAAEAAKNTSVLIAGTVKKISEGTALVDVTSCAFKNALCSTEKISTLIGEIALASAEQSQGIAQVNIAIAEMNKVTQQNAATSEEAAASSEELNAQTEDMRAFVQELSLMVNGVAIQ
jgi:methyl-accepting chemotaxis protein